MGMGRRPGAPLLATHIFKEDIQMAIEYGLQLFSLRDMSDKDLEGTLRAVAEMG